MGSADGEANETTEEEIPRRTRIDQALTNWRSELAELSGVVNQDDINMLDTSVVDLTAAHPSGLAQLYAGRTTHLSSLVRESSALSVARASFRTVTERSDSLLRQFGVAPVYLAIGVAAWNESVEITAGEPTLPEEDGEEAPLPRTTRSVKTPILLRPVRLSADATDATLTLDPSIEVNPVLARALEAYECAEDVDAIARSSITSEGFAPRSVLTRLAALGREYLPGFEMQERLVVGAFVHPGQALAEDLNAVAPRAHTSALVAALAGDKEALQALNVELPEYSREDRAPEAERGVGDLDPAQVAAVEAVGSGASLLLDAPPGSDVAATLAAVLGDAAASGRNVLYVPASGIDGHTLAQTMESLGLGDLVVDLTEDTSWRRNAAEAIKTGMGMQAPELDVTAIVDLRDRLVAVRSRLQKYVEALHRQRAPWGVSAHEALLELAELTAGLDRARTTARVASGHLEQLDEQGLERAKRTLHRAYELGMFSKERSSSPWVDVESQDPEQISDALVRLSKLNEDLLPQVREQMGDCADATGMERASTIAQWDEQLTMLDGVRDSLDIFLPEIFERSAADMVIATASKRWRADRSVEMNGSTRRRFIRQAKDLVRPGRSVADLHAELVKVQQRRDIWHQHNPDGGWPHLPHGLDDMLETQMGVRESLAILEPLIGSGAGRPALDSLPVGDLRKQVRALADDEVTAQLLPEIARLRQEIIQFGLDELATDLTERQVEQDRIDAELTYCWWSSLLSQALRDDPDMGGLDAEALNDLAHSLRELDAAQADSLAGPVHQAVAHRVRAAVQENLEQARDLYRALSREDGVSIKEIIQTHPLALVARPIWIVPPTLVPQVFTEEALIDLVILDASTPVPVSQVLPAFLRGEQVVVVGDPRRGSAGVVEELGALLPHVTLPTGRNTLDVEIAAFLAENGYEGIVETIPTPPGEVPLSLTLVDGKGMPAPGKTAVESVRVEVDQVIDLVIEHALSHPEASLGVVALNARHAEEIRRAISQALSGSPALETFFSAAVAEPFVVVDLSEVRSLRRDHIILSVGYAKTPHGRTIHSFGSVSTPDGMVNLVESMCASRGHTQVVSCLSAQDIDPDRLHAPGARLLREVLRRAEGEPEVAEESVPGKEVAAPAEEAPDRLLVDLAENLWRVGLTVVPHYGAGDGWTIPLAIGHPDYPDELFVAVLTDDEQYVNEPSLRQRDRYWVERLQQRGWRVHMAFSAAVFVDPAAEARKVEELVLSILRAREEAARAPQEESVPEVVEEDFLPVSAAGSAETVADPAAGRAERPAIAAGLPLQAYSDDQLDDLVAWIRSDGVERTEDEEIEELRGALELKRRGTGTDAVLAHAVRRTR